jgi:hypothetical protein
VPEEYHGKAHNELYSAAQEKYFEARAAGNKTEADKYMSEMYKICRACCRNMIKQTLQKKHVYLSNIKDDTEDSALYIIEKYKKPEFKVERLSAYAHFAVLATLYNEKRVQRESSTISLTQAEEEGYYQNVAHEVERENSSFSFEI